jgi:hypothetical protein
MRDIETQLRGIVKKVLSPGKAKQGTWVTNPVILCCGIHSSGLKYNDQQQRTASAVLCDQTFMIQNSLRKKTFEEKRQYGKD